MTLALVERCLASTKPCPLMDRLYRRRFTFIKNHMLAVDQLMTRCQDDAPSALVHLKSIQRTYANLVHSTTLLESLEHARSDTILAMHEVANVFENFVAVEVPLDNLNFVLEGLQMVLAHHHAFTETFHVEAYNVSV